MNPRYAVSGDERAGAGVGTRSVAEKSPFDTVAEMTGLPPVRAAALLRKALFRAGIPPQQATAVDLLAAMPEMEARLAAFMSKDECARVVEGIRRYLESGERSGSGKVPKLADITSALRRANDRLSTVDLDAEQPPGPRKPR